MKSLAGWPNEAYQKIAEIINSRNKCTIHLTIDTQINTQTRVASRDSQIMQPVVSDPVTSVPKRRTESDFELSPGPVELFSTIQSVAFTTKNEDVSFITSVS